MNYKKIQSH